MSRESSMAGGLTDRRERVRTTIAEKDKLAEHLAATDDAAFGRLREAVAEAENTVYSLKQLFEEVDRLRTMRGRG